MPIVVVELEETQDSVTRPVTVGVMRDLINALKLPNDTSIEYKGSGEASAKQGSALGEKHTRASFPFYNQVGIEVDEVYTERGLRTRPVSRRDAPLIFEDRRLPVRMWPVYTDAQLRIDMTYRFQSKNSALRFRDRLRHQRAQRLEGIYHELVYHYPLPRVAMAILKHIHDKREAVAGYDQRLGLWFRECFTPRLTSLTNLNGTASLFAIAEKQTSVEGFMDFTGTTEQAEKENEGGAWVLTFTYTFEYSKPTGVVVEYPIVVHNQLLDDPYIDKTEPYHPNDHIGQMTDLGRSLHQLSRIREKTEPAFEGFVIPPYDDWRPSTSQYNTVTLLSTLIGVDENDPCQIVNLNNLDGIALTQALSAFLIRHRRKLPYYRTNVFHIALYKGGTPLRGDDIYIDIDLNVRTHHPMNLRDRHHLRFGVMKDLATLQEQAQDDLRNAPIVCVQVVDTLDGLQLKNVPLADQFTPQSYSQRMNPDWFWVTPRSNTPVRALRPDGSQAPFKPLPGMADSPVGRRPPPRRPIDYAFRNRHNDWPFERLSDFYEQGGVITGLQAMDSNGHQPALARFEQQYLALVIRHFYQSRLTDIEALSQEDYDARMQDFQSANISLENSGVITDEGLTQPRINRGQPRMTSSPARAVSGGVLLSDELHILGNEVVSRESFRLVVAHLNANKGYPALGQGRGMRTVLITGLMAQRKD